MSFLNTSTETFTTTSIPSHITKPQIIALLHNSESMIQLNPIVKSYQLLEPSSSTAFFALEAAALTPASPESTPTYKVVEDMSGGAGGGGGSWRGGWASRFVPDSITYETSMEHLEDGLRSITHAPMGVHSCTTWCVKDGEGGLVLEERGKVTSNRMLMTFIKTTLQESHNKLVEDFMVALEKTVAQNGKGGDDALK